MGWRRALEECRRKSRAGGGGGEWGPWEEGRPRCDGVGGAGGARARGDRQQLSGNEGRAAEMATRSELDVLPSPPVLSFQIHPCGLSSQHQHSFPRPPRAQACHSRTQDFTPLPPLLRLDKSSRGDRALPAPRGTPIESERLLRRLA
jgi:hypothetical protein